MSRSVLEQNLSDFRDEWVILCGKSARLSGISVRVEGKCEVLCQALRRVLKAHGASLSQDGALVRISEREVFIDCSGEVAELILAPIYGAGLPEEFDQNAEHEDAIHITDCLMALVEALEHFSAGKREIRAPQTPLIERAEALRALRLLQKYPNRIFFDDLSYDGKLRALQQTELGLLLEFDRVCRENGISYFLGGGTLLGAVRHGGFIPWDDDVDVMMDRENFDRLAEIAPRAVGENFFFQNSTTDPNYHSPFHKLRAKGTLFVTEFSQRFEMEQGVFLDVFAHDATSKSPKWQKIHIFLTTFARSMVFHKWDDSPMHFYGRKKLLCRIASFFVRHSSMERLEKIERRIMTRYNRKNTGFLYDGMGEHLQHGAFDAKILQKSTTLMFEGHPFPVPEDYDAYLRFSYGDDYMTLPRPSLRRAHHSAVRFSLGEK